MNVVCVSVGRGIRQIGQVERKEGENIQLPGQCSFHCTKPDSSAEKTAVHALLYEDYEDSSFNAKDSW